MSVSFAVLQDHIEYSAWASLRLLDAAGNLSDEEAARDFQTANRNVVGTMTHIFAADRSWLARIQSVVPLPGRPTEAEHNLAFLQTAVPDLHRQWAVWASTLTADSSDREIVYRDLKQNEWKQPLWQIILHVVNHATHHRGQVAGFLRSMGHTPPPLDIVFYHRRRL